MWVLVIELRSSARARHAAISPVVSFIMQPKSHPLRGDTTRSELGLPTSIINQASASPDLLTGQPEGGAFLSGAAGIINSIPGRGGVGRGNLGGNLAL